MIPDTRVREVEVRTTSIPVASQARAREACASCRAIQRAMLEDPASAQPQTCAVCGALGLQADADAVYRRSTEALRIPGSAWIACTGTCPMKGIGTPCIRMAKASSSPNRKQVASAGSGFQLANIRAASAMKPLPAVICGRKLADWETAR